MPQISRRARVVAVAVLVSNFSVQAVDDHFDDDDWHTTQSHKQRRQRLPFVGERLKLLQRTTTGPRSCRRIVTSLRLARSRAGSDFAA